MNERRFETATLAGGCFWCLEAVFERLRGVERVVSGYSGGSTAAPRYHDVCSGRTADRVYDAPIVTELKPFTAFFAAEDYHQGYYQRNTEQPYCRAVIGPKVIV